MLPAQHPDFQDGHITEHGIDNVVLGEGCERPGQSDVRFIKNHVRSCNECRYRVEVQAQLSRTSQELLASGMDALLA